jgi:tonB-dependent receptor protein
MKRISLSRLTAVLLILTNLVVGTEDIVLGEVAVIANKISENLNDVPQSISVVDSTELEERDVKNVEELTKTIPSITGVSGMYEGISTRGLNPSIFTSSNPVTVYVGGVAQSNKDAAYIPITNIDHVEILRGPSSAIYGKDSIGGVIILS